MTDPGLRARLGQVTVPTLVVWGDSDRIVDPDYGRAYAAAIPGARLRLLPARATYRRSRPQPSC